MGDVKDALKRKFSVLGNEIPVAGNEKLGKAAEGGKDRRKKITLRPSEEMMRNLVLLKRVLGKDMNGLCLELMADQVSKRLGEARARVSPGEWDVIVKYAEGLDG
jgi:hypothetical protein